MRSSTIQRVEAWRADPHPVATVRLCKELIASEHVRPSLAVWLAGEATALHDDDVRVLGAAGHLLLTVGELARAKEILVRALAIAPDDLGLHHLLGEVLLRAGDFLGFERVLKRAAALRRAGAELAPPPVAAPQPTRPARPDEDLFSLSLDDEPTQTTSMDQILAAALGTAPDEPGELDESGERAIRGSNTDEIEAPERATG